MSTRATYQFISEWSGTHTVYIHHDNYPQGAAMYFTDSNSESIYNVNTFIRNNETAQLTESHQIHGDTEYRYTVEGTRLIAQKRINFTDKFETFFDGSVADFVQEYHLLRSA
tara:strand:+ start:605 stop:940 length:336 start_codon:yes stop_codon:yes gene_type:complete